jgi:hypothetical protein
LVGPLVETGLDGKLRLDWNPDGFACEIFIPLAHVAAYPVSVMAARHCALSEVENLMVFDDFGRALATGLALERALVVIWLVGLDARQPHRRAAPGTVRMFDFLM